jgi:hypothetical protein
VAGKIKEAERGEKRTKNDDSAGKIKEAEAWQGEHKGRRDEKSQRVDRLSSAKKTGKRNNQRRKAERKQAEDN